MSRKDAPVAAPRWLLDGIEGGLLSPDDRGLLYGDGLFETIAFHHGRSALWSRHMARLARGCAELDLLMPAEDLLADEARRLVRGLTRAVLRITLTRGAGGSGYIPLPGPQIPTRLLQRRAFPHDLDRLRAVGLDLKTSTIRLDALPPAGVKHLSRLTQVLIGRELYQRGGDEAVVLDAHGHLVEALHGNLIVVRDGRLIEPLPHPAAVAGIGLQWLRARAADGLERRELRRDELRRSDGLWVINSVRGPIHARSLDGEPRDRDPLIDQWQALWQQDIER